MSTKVILIFLFFLVGTIACENKREDSANSGNRARSTPDLKNLKEGDIVVKLGYGLLSRSIANKLHEKTPLSHCGFVFKRGDTLCILHSVAKELTGVDGVQVVDVAEFLNDCKYGSFYSVRIKDSSVHSRIAALASNYFVKKTPFDYTINYDDSSKVNCSEFVYQVLKRAGSPNCFSTITVENKEVLAFNSLIDTAKFTIIYHY